MQVTTEETVTPSTFGAPLADYVAEGEEKVLLTRGRLVRKIPVRLFDLSMSGCLFQTTQPIEPGTTGELHVVLEGTRYHDGVHVVRTSERCGTHARHFGGQFSCGSGLSATSIRSAVRTITTDQSP